MFKPTRRKIGILTATLAAAAVGAVAAPSPALAASCYGDYCSGQDPQNTGCANGAYTTKHYDFGTADLQVRWSPTCQTNWARLVVYGVVPNFRGGTLYAIQDTGYTQQTGVPNSGNMAATYWTPMIYSPVHQVKSRYLTWANENYETQWS